MKNNLIPMVVLVVTSGCSALPDFTRIQSNMDRMVNYMGVMASCMPVMVDSTRRMANNADRLQARADGFIAQLQQDKETAERSIQNYSQAFIDGDRAMIKNLKGIRKELSEMKETFRGREGPVAAPEKIREQARIDRELQARLQSVEARLDAISTKIKQLESKTP